MRDRPFIQAGEQIRPFSEIVSERRQSDVSAAARASVVREIDELEAMAVEALTEGDREAWAKLQSEAEDLRCALDRR